MSALLKNEFQTYMGEGGLARHQYYAEPLSNLQLVLLPMSQFWSKLVWLSWCEHTEADIVCFTTSNAASVSAR